MKIFANHISDTELPSRILKQFPRFNNKKTKYLKSRQNLSRHFTFEGNSNQSHEILPMSMRMAK